MVSTILLLVEYQLTVGGKLVDCHNYDIICVNQKGSSGAREGKDRTHTLKL